jgi:A-kinase anchor protein 13
VTSLLPSKSTEDREEVDGDRENLLDSELPPGEDFPEGFPLSVRHLDTDPFLRIQKEEPETWSASVPDGIAAALKTHEAKRQVTIPSSALGPSILPPCLPTVTNGSPVQEHIYEFIITEKHHCQLLRVIQRVFCEGMTQHLDMKPEILERLFPQLDTLIEMHFEFLRQLRERQDQTAVIPTIADILLSQFQEEQAVRWRSAYGAFCSQHLDAVSIYKEQLKSDRRFHEFVQQCSNNPLLRKMGIPECILTVTTRITKYPLLIEPLIKTAKDRPAEQQKLRSCLALVKNILVDVNGQVAEKERAQRLLEIYNRMDARSSIAHEGRKFKKSDILLEGRKLLFEGLCTLVSPALAPGPGGRGNRSPGPVLVIVVVLTDVVLFLQENNQKYTFVTPEGKAGALPVHSLIAREKQGVDSPKSLYLLSTTEDNTVPGMLELGVVQPRDRQDWISGIRRAVDLSSGGSTMEGKLESEAETARKDLESKYMRMRQLTSELRGRDLDLARLLEDKMRLLGEMLEELGAESPPPASYLPLVQERREGELPGGREQALAQVQEAVKLASSLYSSCGPLGRSASSVGEHQSPGFESPGLPRRAETFGGFDTGREGGEVRGERRGRDGLPGPPLAGLEPGQAAAAVQLTHHLNTVMCMVSEHFTSLEGFKVELAECRERAALGWGRYKHNQQLEELRQAQEQLVAERRSWARHREEQERELTEKLDGMARGQTQLEQEKKDIEQQRNKLFRKLEALRDQGFEFGTNMTVIGPGHLATQQAEPQGFVMEVRKAVSPGGGGEARKQTVSSHSSLPHPGDRKPSSLPPPPPGSKKASESKNHHLLSATNESKGDLHEVKQQIPLALAKLSMGGPKSKEKNRSCSKIDKPSISAPIMPAMMAGSGQMLPFKLSESDRKASGQLPSPKAGYQKLSSNSFAEDRVGRAVGREESTAHARTGSSPASMSGRPMSNTLPKSAGRGPSPPEQRPQGEIQKVNYANSGEEVFYF